MRTRTLFFAILFVALLAAALVLLAAGQIPSRAALKSDLPSETADGQVEQAEVQAVAQSTPQLDALSIMDSHCSSCHVVQNLEKLKKSRSGWEAALAKMERGGVRLNDAERSVLLDYLSLADEP